MFRCAECQAVLLEYVYDVLDAEERALVQAHLDLCPECQTALNDAQGQQQLFASAARMEFSGVQFSAPASTPLSTTPAAPEPVILPLPAQPAARPARVSWSRWAAVAAILICIAIPAGLGLDYRAAYREVQKHEDWIASLDQRHEELNNEAMQLNARRMQKQAERQELVLKNHLTPSLSGPERLEAGGLNEYKLGMFNGLNQMVPGKFREVRVIDRQNGDKVVYEKKNLQTEGELRLALPKDLPVGPDSRLSLQVVADSKNGESATITEDFPLTPATYLTHLYTDKPMYQPGEQVRFRSLTLERFSLQPANETLDVTYTLTTPRNQTEELPRGNVGKLLNEGFSDGYAVMGPERGMLRGIAGGEWTIPETFPGGEYILTVQDRNNRFPPQQRKFVVNKFSKPRLMKELTWSKRTYGPGNEVLASCIVKNSEGAVKNCPVEFTINIDGKNYGVDGKPSDKPGRTRTDDTGKAIVRFTLPDQIERGIASLNLAFLDGGSPDPLLKPIPIALKKFDIEFYPEGGQLVPYIPNRVYFQARTTQGKPADLKGRLVDDTGEVWALVETLSDDKEPGVNQGMGVFQFTPLPVSSDSSKFRKYWLEIDSPKGFNETYPLKVDTWGVVAMSIPSAVTSSYQPIDVKLRSIGKERKLLVGAYCRGRLFDHVRVTAPAGQDVPVRLQPALGVGGVYRVTVFEEEDRGGTRPLLIPRAERLVYRQQRERLNLEVALAKQKSEKDALAAATPDADRTKGGEKGLETFKQKESANPGGKVSLELKARGEDQEPIPAIVMVGVVDQGVIKLADEKTARSMPTHFLLTSEVRKPEELEYADFLLTTHPKANQALDLLLGTQGWRRFVEQKPGEIRAKLLEEAQMWNAQATNVEVPRVVQGRDPQEEQRSIEAKMERELEKIAKELQPEYQELMAKTEKLGQDRLTAFSDPAYEQAVIRAEAWSARLATARNFLPVIGIFAIILGGILLARGLNVSPKQALPYFFGVLSCVAVVGFCFLFVQIRAPMQMPESKEKDGRVGQRIGTGAPLGDRAEFRAPLDNIGEPGGGIPVPTSGVPEKMPQSDPKKSEHGEQKKPNQSEAPSEVRGNPPPAPPVMPAPLGGGATAGSGSGFGIGGMGAFGFAGGMPGRNSEDLPAFRMRPSSSFSNLGTGNLPRPMMDRGKSTDGKGKGPLDPKTRTDDAEAEMTDNLNKKDLRGSGGVRKSNRGDGWNYSEQRKQQARQLLKDLNQEGDKKEGKDDSLDTGKLFMREYAHSRGTKGEEKKDQQQGQGQRHDFTDTVFWHPALVLPQGDGRISFDLSDSVTTYQVTVFGHTLDGRIAAAKPFTFDTRLPLVLDSVIAPEVSAGDKPIAALTASNNTDERRDVDVRLKNKLGVTTFDDNSDKFGKLSLEKQSRGRRLFQFTPMAQPGKAELHFEAESNGARDSIQRSINITAEGFPVVGQYSDLLEGGQARHSIDLPETHVPGTLRLRLQAFPSTLADLQKGLEGLLREPHGCFEQTSTTNYPNVMILSYLHDTKQAKPELERRARELMESGYHKLTSFECRTTDGKKREGYEWFGGTAPPHEALTAYGLLQFRDMARFSEVDRDMMERTRKYLLSTRDGKGGFTRNARSSGQFGRAPDHVTNAYIVWALTESVGPDDLMTELNAVHETAKTSNDPYFLSLIANSLINRGKTKDAVPLLDKIIKLQDKDGVVTGATTSITGSGGRDLQIETTSLALLAWLKADPGRFGVAIDRAVKWIGRQRGDGGAFGSTQATILALKALIAHTKGQRPVEKGSLTLWVNDVKAGEVNIAAGASEALVIELSGADKLLKPGKNNIRIEATGKNQFPYTLGWTYQTLKPISDPRSILKLNTSLSKTKVTEGDSVRMTVKLENTSKDGQGMAIAIVGLPGGLSLPEDLKQLREHVEAPKDGRPLLSMFEVRGRELILYWRDLAPHQVIELPVDLSCRVPGEYSGPASRAYLYYNAYPKTWVAPLKVNITPRAE